MKGSKGDFHACKFFFEDLGLEDYKSPNLTIMHLEEQYDLNYKIKYDEKIWNMTKTTQIRNPWFQQSALSQMVEQSAKCKCSYEEDSNL